MSDQKDTITITLTARRPVRISKADWPIAAEASDHLYDGQYDFQANIHTRARLLVRQHRDGRAIVYGTYSQVSAYQGARNAEARRGRMLAAGEDIPTAIRRVAEEMDEARSNSGAEDLFQEPRPFARLAAECTADLPAEEV